MLTLKEIKPDDPNYYKPLNELIEDLGHAEPASRYGDVQIMVEDLTDALHYLQAFRDAKDTLEREKDRYAEAVRNCDKAEAKYTMLCMEYAGNDPLTWDELKQMEGKPVWVEYIRSRKCWHIIRNIQVASFDGKDHDWLRVDMDGVYFDKDDLGKTWQAYRKERG